MPQAVPKDMRRKFVSQNSEAVDEGSAGRIFPLSLTVLALCSHHLETYIHNLGGGVFFKLPK